ncbi:MAG: hypothetical protein ACI9JM_000940 [Halioglobus sp.]|jgi:hypothetical protein
MTETPNEPVVFFVHVMKTGGTTVLQSLLGTYPDGTRFPEAGVDVLIEAKGSPQHLFNLEAQRQAALRWICPHVPYSAAARFREEQSREVPVTLVLRDGLERAVSHLKQVARRFDHAYSYQQLLDLPLLGEFFFTNHQTRALGLGESGWEEWDRCFRELITLQLHLDAPESSFEVSTVDQEHLDRALAVLPEVDVLGLQDEFDDWWLRCSKAFGWPTAPAASVNVGARLEASDAPPIPDSVIDQLRERNTLDIQLYAAARERLKA